MQTVNLGFEKFLNEFNLQKGSKGKDQNCEHWGMDKLERMYKKHLQEQELMKFQEETV